MCAAHHGIEAGYTACVLIFDSCCVGCLCDEPLTRMQAEQEPWLAGAGAPFGKHRCRAPVKCTGGDGVSGWAHGCSLRSFVALEQLLP